MTESDPELDALIRGCLAVLVLIVAVLGFGYWLIG